MEGNTGLLIGIDIQENCSQVCFFDIPTREPQNILFSDKKTMLDNPAELSNWGEISKNGGLGEMERLVNFVEALIEYAVRLSKNTQIDKICITVEHFQIDILDCISVIMDRLQIGRDKWIIIGHEESYAYYAYNQRKELYVSGVMLLNYKKDGIYAHLMRNGKRSGTEVIMENRYVLESDTVRAACGGSSGLADIQKEIIAWLSKPLQEHIVSSVYLTGEGFQVETFPDEFTRFLCGHRKVFAGQNIFVKGACFAAYEEAYKNLFGNVVLACQNRVTTGIEMDILERGVKKRLRVVKPGTNWYQARRKMDFILDDVNRIVLMMKPCDTGKEYTEEIDISEIPYYKGKMTRIGLEFDFHAHDRCTVVVKDKGFGDFVKSSGKVLYQELMLKG